MIIIISRSTTISTKVQRHLNFINIGQAHREGGGTGDTSPGGHELRCFLFLPFWAASSQFLFLSLSIALSECFGRKTLSWLNTWTRATNTVNQLTMPTMNNDACKSSSPRPPALSAALILELHLVISEKCQRRYPQNAVGKRSL